MLIFTLVIFPNSPAAANLPPAELEKRQASFNARRAVLRSNPSLFISKTRLSIRQLPLFVTDRVLKRLAIHSIRAFDAEVKAGEREGLTRAEETDTTLSAALAARHDKAKGNAKGKGGKGGKERETPVIQSKVVRQAEKSDALTGMGRSKGYGFLELRSHKEALKVVRWANNNPEAGKLMWEWWKVEMGELLERTKKCLAQARDAKSTKVPEAEGGGEEMSDEKQKQKPKSQESVEELESRVRKLESRLAEGDDRSEGGMRGGKTLIMEFSVENVQVSDVHVGCGSTMNIETYPSV
jgi:nucleolar protein 4